MNVLLDLATSLALSFSSRRRLESQTEELLLQKFLVGGRRVLFFKSGRSALSAIFKTMAQERPTGRVLVPDYICNVVPRAVGRAGLKAVAYRTTEHFEPALDDLFEKLAEPSVAAVVMASLFGSQNTSQAMVEQIRKVREDVLVVLDDCQNLLLNRALLPDPRTAVVFSFNLKTIAGAMGGGVCLGENSMNLQHPETHWLCDFLLECAVVRVFVRQVCLRAWSAMRRALGRRVYPPPGLEYSNATRRIHYDMVPQRIAKLSLIRGIIQMRSAAETESMRKRNFEALRSFLKRTGAGEIVPTNSPAFAPFVPVRLTKSAFLTDVPWKGPYALEGDPQRTIRPELSCFKNDGLDHFSALMRGKRLD